MTALHLCEAGPVTGDLTQQPVVAGGALDHAVIMRAAADLSRPLQHEILVWKHVSGVRLCLYVGPYKTLNNLVHFPPKD